MPAVVTGGVVFVPAVDDARPKGFGHGLAGGFEFVDLAGGGFEGRAHFGQPGGNLGALHVDGLLGAAQDVEPVEGGVAFEGVVELDEAGVQVLAVGVDGCFPEFPVLAGAAQGCAAQGADLLFVIVEVAVDGCPPVVLTF